MSNGLHNGLHNGLVNGLSDGLNNGLDNGLFNGLYGELGHYDKEFLEYCKRRTTPLDESEKTAYNTFFVSVKRKYGVNKLSDLADCIWIWRGDQRDSLLNLVKTNHTAIRINNPSYSRVIGFNGTVLGSYLDLNYNPFRQGVKYLLNYCSWGYYNQDLSNVNARNMGSSNLSGTQQITSIPYELGNFFYAINSGLLSVASTNAKAHFFVSRMSNQVSVYRNGSLLTTTTNSAVGIPDLNLFAFTRNINGSPSTNRQDSMSCMYFARANFEINAELQALAKALKFNT